MHVVLNKFKNEWKKKKSDASDGKKMLSNVNLSFLPLASSHEQPLLKHELDSFTFFTSSYLLLVDGSKKSPINSWAQFNQANNDRDETLTALPSWTRGEIKNVSDRLRSSWARQLTYKAALTGLIMVIDEFSELGCNKFIRSWLHFHAAQLWICVWHWND